MNNPVAPGRIRWAILCLALAASGSVPAAAQASPQRVEVIVQMDAGSAPAAGKAAVRAAGGSVTGDLPIVNGFAAELSAPARPSASPTPTASRPSPSTTRSSRRASASRACRRPTRPRSTRRSCGTTPT